MMGIQIKEGVMLVSDIVIEDKVLYKDTKRVLDIDNMGIMRIYRLDCDERENPNFEVSTKIHTDLTASMSHIWVDKFGNVLEVSTDSKSHIIHSYDPYHLTFVYSEEYLRPGVSIHFDADNFYGYFLDDSHSLYIFGIIPYDTVSKYIKSEVKIKKVCNIKDEDKLMSLFIECKEIRRMR